MNSQGKDLRDIKVSLNWVTASMQARSHEEKSILTTYTEDDKNVWKTFRRELIRDGFSHRTLGKHKETIKQYVMELGERGALDEPVPNRDDDGGEISTVSDFDFSISGNTSEEGIEESCPRSPLAIIAQGSDILSDDSRTSEPEVFETTHSLPEPFLANFKTNLQTANNHAGSNTEGGSSPQSLYTMDSMRDLEGFPDGSLSGSDDSDLSDLSSLNVIPSVAPSPLNGLWFYQASVEEVQDAAFLPGAHPNCYTERGNTDSHPKKTHTPSVS